MKNDGTEVEDDIYEAYNLTLLLAGQKGSIAEGHGVRLNGEKYMHLKVRDFTEMARLPSLPRSVHTHTVYSLHLTQLLPSPLPSLTSPLTFMQVLTNETYNAKVKEADGSDNAYPVTIDQIHVLKKGSTALMIGEKGGYFMAVYSDSSNAKQQGPDAIAAMAIGFYYCVGPDSA